MMGGAQPGDTLYGVHTKLLGEPPSVHDERIAQSANTELDRVEQMIALGQWDEAQDKLAAVSDRVQTVKDGDDLGIEGYHRVAVKGNVIKGAAWIDVTKENMDQYKL